MIPEFHGLQSIYIHPGEACFSDYPIVVSTVLGSCLSITMFSSKTKYAGISHCQLPYCRDCYSNCNNCFDPYKYVSCTIKIMIKKFERLQILQNDIEVKIFGGADVLRTSACNKSISSVGSQNIQSAIETLAKFNIHTTTNDVGGQLGRKLYFLTDTGEIFLSRLRVNG